VLKLIANICFNHYLEGKEELKIKEEEKGDLNEINKIINPPKK
jgi:phenylalanine-4-hydroxylase